MEPMSVKTDPLGDSLDVGQDVSRYDLLLATLPLPLLLGVFVGGFSPLATHIGVSLGSIPSVLLLSYGLFVDSPVEPCE